MSGFLSHFTPRWSTRTTLGGAVGSPRSIAREPRISAIVLVGPPLSASLPNLSGPPNKSPATPNPAQPIRSPIRLWPSEWRRSEAKLLQSLPAVPPEARLLSATIVFRALITLPAPSWRPPPAHRQLPSFATL